MKHLLIAVLLLTSISSYSQTQDLISLAQGDFLGMNALFKEDGSLFGYISIYDYGKSGEKTKKFEYVILDKNLNPFANNKFEGDITAGDYWGYISFNGSVILKPSRLDVSHVKRRDVFLPSSMIINLDSNTIKKKVFYEYDHGTFKEVLQHDSWKDDKKEYKQERKEKGYVYSASVGEIKEGGYMVEEYDDYGSYATNNILMRYDENKKLQWKYPYNKNGSEKQFELMYFLEKDEDHYYAILRKHLNTPKSYEVLIPTGKNIPDTFYLLVLDMKTGKELHRKEIPDPEEFMPFMMSYNTYSYGALDNDKSFDDKIVVVGKRNVKGKGGVARLLIDRETFDTDLKILSYTDFEPYIPKIKANGYVEKGYFIDARDIFFMKDGGVSILYEKYKPAGEYTAQKTTDMVYVTFDKDFNISGAQIMEKEKSKWSNTDYLFSQNLNDGNDMVFFYRDFQKDEETRDKNWNLFINTYIDGKFKQETIPISSKENYIILPYIAKQGYIMLQELNKEARYNQVRLERLNY